MTLVQELPAGGSFYFCRSGTHNHPALTFSDWYKFGIDSSVCTKCCTQPTFRELETALILTFLPSTSDTYRSVECLERAMDKIRVLVANRPRLMRELVLETISGQPDIEIVGEVTDTADIERTVAESKPDFVIIALDEADRRPVICDGLLAHSPATKILALAPERNSSLFFWTVFDIRSARVESSEEGILNVLRGKAPAVVPQ